MDLMHCTLLIEDATGSAQKQRDAETPGGVSPLAEVMFMGQKYKLGVFLVCHGLAGLGTLIQRNTEAWIVTRIQGEDPYLFRNVLGLTPEQVDQMRTLRPGTFAIFNPNLWPKPVLASFSSPAIPGVCDNTMQKDSVVKFLAKVTTKPPVNLSVFLPEATVPGQSTEAPSPMQDVPQPQIEILVMIASGPPKTVGAIYELMGLSRTQGRRNIKALENLGFVCAHRFSGRGMGGQICFFEILEPGWMFLEPRGLSRPASLTHGGFEHDLAARLLKTQTRERGKNIEFEVDLNSMVTDSVVIDKQTGARTYYNIGVSEPTREIDSLLHFFTLPVSQTASFVLIVRDGTFLKKVQKHLKDRKINDAILKQVQFQLIADLITK